MSVQSLVGSGTGVGLWPGRRREVERVFERGGFQKKCLVEKRVSWIVYIAHGLSSGQRMV